MAKANKQLKITLNRSLIGKNQQQRQIIEALGLKKNRTKRNKAGYSRH